MGVAYHQPARRSLALSVSPRPAKTKRSDRQLFYRINCEFLLMSGLVRCIVVFHKVIPMTCVHITLCRAEDRSGFLITS